MQLVATERHFCDNAAIWFPGTYCFCGERGRFECVLMRSMVRSSVLLRAATDTQARLLQADGAAHPLPLPLGEVAERSEDGEGCACSPAVPCCAQAFRRSAPRRSGAASWETAAKPSQSPSVTALPKGEPRACCRACPYALFSTTHQSQNCRLLSIFGLLTAPKLKKPSVRSHRGQVSTEPPPNGPIKLLKTSFY